jgi:hypothetical protein
VADGDPPDHLSFDVLASAEEVAPSRENPLAIPSVVIASRIGRWLDLDDASPGSPSPRRNSTTTGKTTTEPSQPT